VAPASVPIKKTPDITDIIGEGVKERRDEGGTENGVESGLQTIDIIKQTDNITPQTNTLTPSLHHSITPSLPHSKDFSAHWHTMFEQVFYTVPTIYIPLKETLPQIENNIIKISVKNEVQKEHFEAKKRDVLAYMRTHFDERVEDIMVETNEQLETKKIIYDIKDKLLNFKEQNIEFDEFVQILDLKIKD
jgi:hypothetical protein